MPYDAFKTKDLYFLCGAVNDKQFVNFCNLIGKPELPSEERFQSNDARVNHREDLMSILNEVFAAKTTDEWQELFDGSGLPYGAINTMERVFSHPQTAAREMVHEVPFEPAKSGKFSMLGEWSRLPRVGEETDLGVQDQQSNLARLSRLSVETLRCMESIHMRCSENLGYQMPSRKS